MADDEVATLTDGVADVMKVATQQYRPASPIIDIYGDEEDSYDHGGTINVSLNCFYFLNKNRLLFFQNRCFSFSILAGDNTAMCMCMPLPSTWVMDF